MAKRVTIMVDDDLDKKLRDFQARQIEKTEHGYSYSMAVNTILARVVSKDVVEKAVKRFEKDYRRVTIMVDEKIDEKIRIKFGRHIIQCAMDHCEMPSWSYSREINAWLRAGFKAR